MLRHQGPVLVDTNVILECHRVKAWRALTGGYCVETVEDCMTETQTGFQRRRSGNRIDAKALRDSLKAVHDVTDHEQTKLAVKISGIALDKGEASLWAHALGRNDAWVLCGPDRASLRCGIRLGFREKLVSLERLLAGAGYHPGVPLRLQYKRNWHTIVMNELVMAERNGP